MVVQELSLRCELLSLLRRSPVIKHGKLAGWIQGIMTFLSDATFPPDPKPSAISVWDSFAHVRAFLLYFPPTHTHSHAHQSCMERCEKGNPLGFSDEDQRRHSLLLSPSVMSLSVWPVLRLPPPPNPQTSTADWSPGLKIKAEPLTCQMLLNYCGV